MPPKKRPPPTPSRSSPSPKKSLSPASAAPDLDLVRGVVECPICFEVPRDGVMLQCHNGHNICATCKNKMGQDAKCPQGQCDYLDRPTRNLAIADIIERFPFEFKCKNAATNAAASASSCDFKGTREQLGPHEEACEFRPVICPWKCCKESVPARSIFEHSATAHKAESRKAHLDVIENRYLWNPQRITGSWNAGPFATSAGCAFPIAYGQDGQIYLWLLLVAPKSQTEKLRCQITLKKDSALTTYSAPVYSIDDWTKEKILKDESCVCLSNYSIRQVLTDDISEKDKKEGFVARFQATFKLVKNSA